MIDNWQTAHNAAMLPNKINYNLRPEILIESYDNIVKLIGLETRKMYSRAKEDLKYVPRTMTISEMQMNQKDLEEFTER